MAFLWHENGVGRVILAIRQIQWYNSRHVSTYCRSVNSGVAMNWNSRNVNTRVVMSWSPNLTQKWQKARAKISKNISGHNSDPQVNNQRWQALPHGKLRRINVDASVCLKSFYFLVVMLLRDKDGTFLRGKIHTVQKKTISVFEAK